MNKRFALYALVIVGFGAMVGGLFGKLPSTISADNSVTTGKIVADYREALDVVAKN